MSRLEGRRRSSTALSVSSVLSAFSNLSSVSGDISNTRQSIGVDFAPFLELNSEKLREPLGDIEPKKLNKLQKAVYENNIKLVKNLLSQRSRNVNKLDTHHRFSALHVASAFGYHDCAMILLNPNLLSSNSSSIFGKRSSAPATTSDPLKICDVNIRDKRGRTPLTIVRAFCPLP